MTTDWCERRRPEHCELRGDPRPKLVREVRRTLWSYIRCRPQRDDKIWKLAWEWAASIAVRDSHYGLYPGAKRQRWPSASEIATQYLVLALAEMRSCSSLRLHHNAAKYMPEAIQQRLAAIGSSRETSLIEYAGSAPRLENSGGTS